METKLNFRKLNEDSHQEALLRQRSALSASDLRHQKRFQAQLTEEERCALERNAHYDGDAWRHLREGEPASLPLWEGEQDAPQVETYEETFLGFFNVLAGRARRFSPAMPHQHSFVELYYVVRGVCADTIEGQELSLVPGDLVILQPGVTHALSVPGNCVVYQAAIRERTFRNICQDLLASCHEPPRFMMEPEQEAFVLFRTGVDPALLDMMEQMLTECARPHKYFNVMLQGQLASLMALLLNEQEPEDFRQCSGEDTAFSESHLKEYIRRHLSEVTLQTAAAHFGFSASYFCTMIRRKLGVSFSALLQEEKLSAAERMLIETKYPIRMICEEAGYESVSQFYGTFKRKYGVSPGDYRRHRME